MKKTLSIITAAVLWTSHSFAYEAGDIFVRAGTATVAPDASSGGVAIPALDIAAIAGTGVDVDNDTQLGLTFTYMINSRFGVELLAATPFSHDVTADLNAAGLPGIGKVDVGSTKQLPPTLSAVWYPLGSSQVFKPYLGAGLNYTAFFDTDVSDELETGVPVIVDTVTGGTFDVPQRIPMKLDLDDSLGLALTAGFDYQIDETWHFNATVRWVDIGTDAKITNRDLGTVITVNGVDIDPWVYQLNVGYRF